jgi:serine/threonine protein phosphatase PrpC
MASELARVVTAAQSDIGRTRSENQDAFGEFATGEGERLLVVADGMGGHRGGATASRVCVETVGRAFAAGTGATRERLHAALVEANARVHEAAAADPELTGMGATVVALVLGAEGSAELGWIGDSRAYRFRGGTAELLSEDHSVVSQMVRAGVITEAEAETHPRRNELLLAVGPTPTVEPSLRSLELAPGDRFLLCTDGLWGSVPKPELSAVLGFEAPELAVRKLVARANEHGGPDNVTALIAWLPEEVTGPVVAPDVLPAPAPRSRFAVLLGSAAAVAALLIALALYLLQQPGGDQAESPSAPAPEVSEVTPAPAPVPALAPAAPTPAAKPVTPPKPQARAAKPPPKKPARPAQTPPAAAPAPTPAPAEAEQPPAPAPDPLAETQTFLGSWQTAVERQDYALYAKLGLPEDESTFKSQYVDKQAKLAFSLRDVQRREGAEGYVVRVGMTTDTHDAEGDHRLQEERSFILQQTPAGLRYAGEAE